MKSIINCPAGVVKYCSFKKNPDKKRNSYIVI